MIERLFVYGTLAPGRPNEHILAEVPGEWEPATVIGTLHPEGWGAAAGYPGIVLDEQGGNVEGLLFSSESLGEHWARLDEFEGDGYERVLTRVKLRNGANLDAYIYRLSGTGPHSKPLAGGAPALQSKDAAQGDHENKVHCCRATAPLATRKPRQAMRLPYNGPAFFLEAPPRNGVTAD